MLIPYPIPEADRARLIAAGKKACKFHKQANGNDRMLTPEYEEARAEVDTIEKSIRKACCKKGK